MPDLTGISDPNNPMLQSWLDQLGIDPTDPMQSQLVDVANILQQSGMSADYAKQFIDQFKGNLAADQQRTQAAIDSGWAFQAPPDAQVNYFSLPQGQMPQAAWTYEDMHRLQEDMRQRALQGIGRVATVVGGSAIGGTLAGLGGTAGAADLGGAGVLAAPAATSGVAGVAAGVPAGTALTAGIPGISGGLAGGALAAGGGVLANSGLTGVAIPSLGIPGTTVPALTDLAAGGLQAFPAAAGSGALTGITPGISLESPPSMPSSVGPNGLPTATGGSVGPNGLPTATGGGMGVDTALSNLPQWLQNWGSVLTGGLGLLDSLNQPDNLTTTQGGTSTSTSSYQLPDQIAGPVNQGVQGLQDIYNQGYQVAPLGQPFANAVSRANELMNPANVNPYLNTVFNAAAGATQNRLASEFANAGSYGTPQNQQSRSQELQTLAAGIYGPGYEAAQNRAAGLVPTAANMGLLEQQNQQAMLNAPFTNLQQYLAGLQGLSGFYPATQTQNTTQTGNVSQPLFSNPLAGFLGGYNLGSSIFG